MEMLPLGTWRSRSLVCGDCLTRQRSDDRLVVKAQDAHWTDATSETTLCDVSERAKGREVSVSQHVGELFWIIIVKVYNN
jgi:hypothetical protein